jgi:hypothetical protein
VPRAEHAGRAEHSLHLRLVPEVDCGRDVDAVDAEVLADLGERHLELFEHADEALHRTDLTAQAAHRLRDLGGVESVVDAPVRGRVLPQSRRHPFHGFGRDQAELDAGQPGRALDESVGGLQQVRRHEGNGHHVCRSVLATGSVVGIRVRTV